MRTAVESETLNEEMARSLKTICESSDSKELKEFLPRLEESLAKASNDASKRLTEEIEKANVLQGQVTTLTESLNSANQKLTESEGVLKALREEFDKAKTEWSAEKDKLLKKSLRLQERVDLMVGNIKKYRSASYKAPDLLEGVVKEKKEVTVIREQVTKQTKDDERLHRLLK
jgi:uncharacterized phage infection (PIP) family protein YhgE